MTTTAYARAARRDATPRPGANSYSRALDDMKAVNVKVLDVRGLTDIADTMIIASGNSDRHVRSIAERVVAEGQGGRLPAARRSRARATANGCWSTCTDVLVHVMLPRVREFYGLESLWEAGAPVAAAGEAAGRRARRGGATAARRALAPAHARARDRRGHAHARLGTQRLPGLPRAPGRQPATSRCSRSSPARAAPAARLPRRSPAEAKRLLAALRPGEHVVALDERGTQFTTRELAALARRRAQQAGATWRC